MKDTQRKNYLIYFKIIICYLPQPTVYELDIKLKMLNKMRVSHQILFILCLIHTQYPMANKLILF